MKGEFEKRLSRIHILPFFERTEEVERWIDEAHKDFVTLDTARRIGAKITKLKGKELIQWAEAYANSKNEKWVLKWFGEKDATSP